VSFPVLRFTDPQRAPQGAFVANAILNDNLRPAMVPTRHASWEAIEEFALSYDGYGYWSDVAELANRCLRGWTRDRSLPGTVDELRGCLFYEQRRWHHFGQEPQGRATEYFQAMLDAIAELVQDMAQAPSRRGPAAEAG
jgi:hypothetical protein